ncbi:uncharacterized protein LOC143893556 isoform X1 [Temnothorax americanus]|uniref:uncharacterized protein LOC143893556 isoform X1 n=1 Tax=Temnothorax americanus TaxID=1964332 RepID=UPI0040684763
MMMNNERNKSPPIKCGYCGWLLDGLLYGFVDVSLLQHNCLIHYNEEKHLLHIDDNNVATIIENKINRQAFKQLIQVNIMRRLLMLYTLDLHYMTTVYLLKTEQV